MGVDDIGRPRGVLDRLAARLVAALADPAAAESSRPRDAQSPLAVIVPARNEAHSIGDVVDRIVAQLRPGDEFVVVDDHSDDGTAVIARGRGAPCRDNVAGAGLARQAERLLARGRDHRRRRRCCSSTPTCAQRPHLLDDIDAVARTHPDAVVSVQPWHRTERWYEQASLLCNVAALMGSGAFTVLGERVHPTVAFGPVLAMRRVRYEGVGGHEAVRDRHTEDIGLARLAGGAVLFTGRPDTSFRMYPDGWRQLLDGWTRTIAHRSPLDPVVGGARGRLVDRGARRRLAGGRSAVCTIRCAPASSMSRALSSAGCSDDGPDRSTR